MIARCLAKVRFTFVGHRFRHWYPAICAPRVALRSLGKLRPLARSALLRVAPATAAKRLQLGNEELGLLGERLVARCIKRRDSKARILGSRVATPHGEMDLVVLAEGHVICVEVKSGKTRRPLDEFGNNASRSSEAYWRPGHRFDIDDFGRVKRAAHWLARRLSKTAEPLPSRVDLYELVITEGKPHKMGIFHHPGLKDPLPRPVRR